jgi:hypothetical protein
MISFSLRQYDSAMNQLVREVKTGLDKTDHILGQIHTYSVVHGGTMRQVGEPVIVDTEMMEFRAGVAIQLDWFRKTDVEAFVESLVGLWESFASQSKTRLFEILSLTTEAVGNSFSLEGRNFWDAQIEMVRHMEMRFDEDGNHNTEIVVHPDTARKLAENPPTPEQVKRMDEAIDAKRREYYAQKRTRRLS